MSIAGEEIKSFVERFERLEADKKDASDAQKEVMSEAKGRGLDTKVLRVIIAQRKKSVYERAEEAAILEMYKAAMGMV